MSTEPYTPPVSQLLTYGEEALRAAEWQDYLSLGLGQEDIPELIRMATDKHFLSEEASDLEFFATVHAARALGQLKAEAAIKPLLTVLDAMPDNEWFREDMIQIYGMIGAAAIPALRAFLDEPHHDIYDYGYVAETLTEIARQHPEARAEVVSVLTDKLAEFELNNEEVNASLIGSLAHLKEVDALPLIEQAFKADKVDTFDIDLDYVLVEMGLKEPPEEPEFDLNKALANFLAPRSTRPPLDPASIQIVPPELLPASSAYIKKASHADSADRKEKNKRKMVKQSRKKNKRKK